jgi:hypothetical protein
VGRVGEVGSCHGQDRRVHVRFAYNYKVSNRSAAVIRLRQGCKQVNTDDSRVLGGAV